MREKKPRRMIQFSGLVRMSGLYLAKKVGKAAYCCSADCDLGRSVGPSYFGSSFLQCGPSPLYSHPVTVRSVCYFQYHICGPGWLEKEGQGEKAEPAPF